MICYSFLSHHHHHRQMKKRMKNYRITVHKLGIMLHQVHKTIDGVVKPAHCDHLWSLGMNEWLVLYCSGPW